MSFSRRQLLQFAGYASLLSAAPSLVLAQKLEKDAPVLSESERNKRQRELANIDADLQRKRREIQEDSSRRRNEEFATIIEKANAAIKKIAETENYDIVIQDAVTVNPRVDITDKVIKVINSGK